MRGNICRAVTFLMDAVLCVQPLHHAGGGEVISWMAVYMESLPLRLWKINLDVSRSCGGKTRAGTFFIQRFSELNNY